MTNKQVKNPDPSWDNCDVYICPDCEKETLTVSGPCEPCRDKLNSNWYVIIWDRDDNNSEVSFSEFNDWELAKLFIETIQYVYYRDDSERNLKIEWTKSDTPENGREFLKDYIS